MDENLEKELTKLSFEDALKKLETIVARMEEGKSPMEEMMRDFETGSLLAKICGQRLKAVEKKIEILVRDDGKDGQWQEFDPATDNSRATIDTSPVQNPELEDNSNIDEANLPF